MLQMTAYVDSLMMAEMVSQNSLHHTFASELSAILSHLTRTVQESEASNTNTSTSLNAYQPS
jgi:hypothetical protein